MPTADADRTPLSMDGPDLQTMDLPGTPTSSMQGLGPDRVQGGAGDWRRVDRHAKGVQKTLCLGYTGVAGASVLSTYLGSLPLAMRICGVGSSIAGALNVAVGLVRRYQPDPGAETRLADHQPDPQDHRPFRQPQAQVGCGIAQAGVGLLGMGLGCMIPTVPAAATGAAVFAAGLVGACRHT